MSPHELKNDAYDVMLKSQVSSQHTNPSSQFLSMNNSTGLQVHSHPHSLLLDTTTIQNPLRNNYLLEGGATFSPNQTYSNSFNHPNPQYRQGVYTGPANERN